MPTEIENEVSIEGKRRGGFSPSQLSGLSLWLRGDTLSVTPVTSWINKGSLGGSFDAAGAARPAWIASDPDFNNQPSVSFDDTDDQLISTLNLSVWKFLHDGTGCTEFDVFRPTGAGVVEETDNSLQATNPNQYTSWNFNVGNALYWQVSNGSGVALIATSTTGSIPSGTKVQTCRRMATSLTPQFSIRRNGTQDASGAFVGSPSASNPVNTLRIGGANTGLPFGGKIAEKLVYNRALSNTEIILVESYLRGRYGLP